MAPQSGNNADIANTLPVFPWHEIQKHTSFNDRWLVVDSKVYNVTNWQKRHPGGARILGHFAGQDASDAWYAMHNDKDLVLKYMKPMLIGYVNEPINKKHEPIENDFRALRESVEKMGLFKVNPWFYLAHLGHILLLEAVALLLFWMFGTGWSTWLTVAAVLTVSQAQAGWSQHDYGHLSVFNSSRLNHLAHYFVIGHLKAASSHWWNFRHFQHHTKPNIVSKDPDVTLPYVFLLGDKMPVTWANKKRGFMPYQLQHRYFWIFGPPLLLPVYFHLENIYFVFKRRDWVDLFWTLSFFARFFACYTPFLGALGAFGLYMSVRFFESFWFTFVTQMSHIPMEIDQDQQNDWVTSQMVSTCNVDQSFFNDWFTGHLNFQIEHHLFPTMPRHNYTYVAPMVKSLCRKHNLNYISKPLGTAFVDILRSLKKSGKLWYEAYYHL